MGQAHGPLNCKTPPSRLSRAKAMWSKACAKGNPISSLLLRFGLITLLIKEGKLPYFTHGFLEQKNIWPLHSWRKQEERKSTQIRFQVLRDKNSKKKRIFQNSLCIFLDSRDPHFLIRALFCRGLGGPLKIDWVQHLAASLVAPMIKNLSAKWETWVWSLGWEDPLEKGMANCLL